MPCKPYRPAQFLVAQSKAVNNPVARLEHGGDLIVKERHPALKLQLNRVSTHEAEGEHVTLGGAQRDRVLRSRSPFLQICTCTQ